MKADVAARFIMDRVKGVTVTPHNARIQEFDQAFYSQFNIVICGLDNLGARRWINATLCSLVEVRCHAGWLVACHFSCLSGCGMGCRWTTMITPTHPRSFPTLTVALRVRAGCAVYDTPSMRVTVQSVCRCAGFMGQVRVIVPRVTACLECSINTFAPQVTFQLCTLAHTPRKPEHCIAYAMLSEWPKGTRCRRSPRLLFVALTWRACAAFPGRKYDTDSAEDMRWIYERAKTRAAEFGIEGVTYMNTMVSVLPVRRLDPHPTLLLMAVHRASSRTSFRPSHQRTLSSPLPASMRPSN